MKRTSQLFTTLLLIIFGVTYADDTIPHQITWKTQQADAKQEIADHFLRARKILQSLVKDHPAVMQQFDSFSKSVQQIYVAGEGLVSSDVHRIIDATIFASAQHRKQTRKDTTQTPYVIHPIGVAESLVNLGHVRDPDVIIGALLHDTVEDTETTFEMLKSLFGSRVEGFVREVTDDKSLLQADRKRLQVEHASHKSAGAAQIKLADKLYNMTNVATNPPPDWDKARQDAYIEWGKQVTDHLPWVNAPLKNAIDTVVKNYQTKKTTQ
ncbi:MAG: bifunctional (p)ppGpp synthetase/guanosine-3',5'-bis(diphosphate) 3'-pyrophosphohydrolase [Parachlamydiaceae bacterium]|nr:bifunctional (p)ppGpp synthetase/guanosine-3',5'-bis(diphosphate) 3'-pyrophosphohydrolase [Parachlamydiaceae bacterium]